MSEGVGEGAGRAVDCPHGDRCSGCTQLGVPYADQLAFKRRRLALALAPHPELAAAAVAPAAGAEPIVGYRTRVKWMAGPGGSLGLYDREGERVVVDIPGCRVASPALMRVGQALRALRARPGWLREELRAVDLREVRAPRSGRGAGEGEGGVLVTLVVEAAGARPTPALEQAARQAARALGAAAPSVIGVALNVAAPGSPQVLGPTTRHLLGVERAADDLGDVTVEASPGAFVQAHRGVAVRMRAALAAAARGPVLELYGGSGSTGLAIARSGHAVTSVESFRPASEAAGRQARAQGWPLVAVAGDAAQVADEQPAGAFDLVVVNPPRRGLEPSLRRAIGRLSPRAVGYMSCDPSTLGRDLAHLARLGYGPSGELTPNDMIPLTDEVETLALLERRPPPEAVVVAERSGLVAVAKAGHEPVASLEARVRRRPGLERAAALHDPGEEASGLVVFARDPGQAALAAGEQGAAGWLRAARRAVAAGEGSWLALARGSLPRGGTLRRPRPGGGEGVVRFRRRERWLGHSLLELRVVGLDPRRLPALFRELGHPLVGDADDRATARHFFDRHGLDRVFLHATALQLVAPGEGAPWRVEGPSPGDLPLPAPRQAPVG